MVLGCANQAGEDNRNVARMALLLAGLPVEVTGTTVNRLCGSGMDAVGIAARAIASGEQDLVIAGFNGTAFYPSVTDPGSSLTIDKASSSFFTLKTMLYVSFIVPFVIAYIWYAWKAINRKRITGEEMKAGGHVY